jgi:hypothetical protein
MNSLSKLTQAIERSELAYQLYIKEKKFFQAIRIYNSNKLIYSILESILIEEISLDKKTIINFIFHLDDWFSQFDKTLEYQSIELNDTFVFERIEGMFPFPKDFVIILKNQS